MAHKINCRHGQNADVSCVVETTETEMKKGNRKRAIKRLLCFEHLPHDSDLPPFCPCWSLFIQKTKATKEEGEAKVRGQVV
jgi:hypothetical protein